jgi:hypothetical protein
VLDMLAEGLLNKQIAAELQVSEATIKAHVTAIFRKLGVRSRTQAAVAARRLESGHPAGSPRVAFLSGWSLRRSGSVGAASGNPRPGP